MSDVTAKLFDLVPPPKEPVEAPTAKDWSRTEKYLGPKLPSDFKEFVGRYGSGTLAGLYSIFNPCASDKSVNLIERFNEGGANYDERHAESPERFPYGWFPEKPGLIPWGGDTNGNAYFWLVKAKAKPDSWTVVCDEAGEELVEHPLTFSEFLLAMLENRIESSAITFEPEQLAFEPATPVEEVRLIGQEFCEAIRRGDEARVRALLDEGASPNVMEYGESGASPLGTAIQKNSLPMVRLLIERGADVRLLENGNESLLVTAIRTGAPAALRLLLEAGIDVSGGNSSLPRPLWHAVNSRDVELIAPLLEAGADPNASSDAEGRTALCQAIWYGDEELVTWLLEHGASAEAKDKEGITPLAYAKENKKPAIVAILKKAGAKR